MNEDKSPKVCPLLKQHCLEYGVPEWGADPDKEYIIIRILSVEDKSSIISLRRISTSDTPSPPLISLNPILNVISAKTLH